MLLTEAELLRHQELGLCFKCNEDCPLGLCCKSKLQFMVVDNEDTEDSDALPEDNPGNSATALFS